MSLTQLIHLIESFPPNLQREVALFVSFLKERGTRDAHLGYSAVMDLPDYSSPLETESYAVKENELEEIEDIWADEADAETLCELLTS